VPGTERLARAAVFGLYRLRLGRICPKADMQRASWNVGLVPRADIRQADRAVRAPDTYDETARGYSLKASITRVE
jgi:hypothetical protein